MHQRRRKLSESLKATVSVKIISALSMPSISDFMGGLMKILDYFYTEKQVAELLRVNRITVWRWIKKGKFNVQYVGREVLIPKWEIECKKEFRN